MEYPHNERNTAMYMLAGIGTGVLVGALAGLLFAPRRGVETREYLGHRLQEVGDQISDVSQQIAKNIQAAVETSKQEITGMMEKVGAEEGYETPA